MKQLVALLILSMAVGTACRRKEAASPSTPADSAASPPSEVAAQPAEHVPAAPTPPPPTGGKAETAEADAPEAPSTARVQPMDVESLNTIIGDYIASKDRIPKDFAEMVRLKLIPRVPTAPPGFTYEIDQVRGKVIVKKK
jgi:hypothetical protein